MNMKDNYRMKLGSIYLHFWNTPGHTLESSCILLADKLEVPYNENNLKDYNIKAVFTGDTIFLGDVGRPDLTTSKSKTLTKFDLAEMMFDSVQRVAKLPDDVVIYPGHGAGSACGKNISSATSCTVGKQKKNNYAFNIKDKKEFVETLTTGIPPPPDYFFYNADMNKNNNIPSSSDILKKSSNEMSLEEFNSHIKDTNTVILDTRTPAEYKEAHVPKSLFVPLKGKFAIWAGNIIADSKNPIVVLCEKDTHEECIIRLARTGIDNVIGYFSDFDTYKEKGFEVEAVRDMQPEEVFEKYSENAGEFDIVDVRGLGEFNQGHVENAQLVSLNILNKNLDKVDDKKEVFVHCKGGTRSLVAYSFLEKAGFTNIKNINKGYMGLINHEFKIISK
jgi:rhodanese-related sulfurtransferase